MKEKIFKKMEDYGWALEDYNKVYNIHYDFINALFDFFKDKDLSKCDLNQINKEDLFFMVTFIGDFMRAINDID